MNDDISDNNNKSDKTKSNVKHKYLVEIVGTFILVYAIASAATIYSDSGQLGVIGIGLVHALALTAIIYAIGYRSGAQVNPAVTIGLLVARKIGGKEAALYIICQLIGGVKLQKAALPIILRLTPLIARVA
jgi:aquaporin Z